MAMIINKSGAGLPLERFTFSDGCLSAFESDLRNEKFDGHSRWLQRIWDDSYDVGISIRSHHTNKTEVLCHTTPI